MRADPAVAGVGTHIINNIYLLYKDLNPAIAESACINDKEREKKERQVRREKKERDRDTEGERHNLILDN